MVLGVHIPASLSTRWFSRLNTLLTKKYPHMRRSVISVSVISAPEMARLNELYRGKKGPTDVLSFRYHDHGAARAGRESRWVSASDADFGEVIVCLPVLTRQARAAGRTPQEEFRHLVIHGVLHVLGHDHERSADERVMQRMERNLLKGLTWRSA